MAGFEVLAASLLRSPVDLDAPAFSLVILPAAVEVLPAAVNRCVEPEVTLPDAAEALGPVELLVTTPEGFVAFETLAAPDVFVAYEEVLAVDSVVLVVVDVLVVDTEVLAADAEVLDIDEVLVVKVQEVILKFSEDPLKTALSFDVPDEDFAADSVVLLVVLAVLVDVTDDDGGSRTVDSSADFTEPVTTLLFTGDFGNC